MPEPKPALAGGNFPPATRAACRGQRTWRSGLCQCPPPHRAGQGCSAVPKVLKTPPVPQSATQGMQQPFKHCPGTIHDAAAEKRGAGLTQSALSLVGEQINQAQGLAQCSHPSLEMGSGRPRVSACCWYPAPQVWLVSFTSAARSSSPGRAGGRALAGSHSGRAEQSGFLFQDKPQQRGKEDLVTPNHEGW